MRFRPTILWRASLILSVLIGLAPRASASVLEVAPATIDSTGSTDVTEKLQAFIAGVPDGSTISFPAGARYRIDGSLIIEGRKGLTFEGNGAEFFAATEGDRNRRHWWIRSSEAITIRDVVVRGANPNAGTGEAAYRADREAQHGFDFAGVKNSLLERVTVTDVYGDFVYVGRTRTWTSGLTVRNSIFERSGRQGIAITAGEDIRIEHNVIREVRHSTFDIEPNGPDWGARRVTFSDNEIGAGRHNLVASHGRAAPVEDIVVIRNRLEGKTMNVDLKAPESHRRSNFSFIDNVTDTAYSAPGAAIKIEGFDGVTIRGNVVRLDPRRNMTGVNLISTCGALIEGNQFIVAAKEVNRDSYKCATAPTTTMPKQTPIPSSSSVATTSIGAKGAQPTVSTAANRSTVATTGASQGNNTPRPSSIEPNSHAGADADGPTGEAATAVPAAEGRLIDPPSAKDRDGSDDAIWVLAVGAAISALVLVPLSRRSQRSNAASANAARRHKASRKSSSKGGGFR